MSIAAFLLFALFFAFLTSLMVIDCTPIAHPFALFTLGMDIVAVLLWCWFPLTRPGFFVSASLSILFIIGQIYFLVWAWAIDVTKDKQKYRVLAVLPRNIGYP